MSARGLSTADHAAAPRISHRESHMSHSTSRLVLAALALCSALIGCTDTKTISTPIPAGKRSGEIELNPVFSQSARTIAAKIADVCFPWLDAPVRRIASADTWVGYAPRLEDSILPQIDDVKVACREIMKF